MMKKQTFWIFFVCLLTTLFFSIGVLAVDRTEATNNAEPEGSGYSIANQSKPLFTDVLSNAWYFSDVKTAWETGLINGFEDNTFRPEENMSYAQAVKLAACMNQKYTTGAVALANGSPNWYDSYVAYAKSNNIISRDYEWDVSATRAEYVEIFANALPEEALKAKNSIDDWAVPDVDMGHPQSAAIYKLYRAGILTGMDNEGNFQPNNNIKRSEVSAILTRMMNENARKNFTLKFPITPDTPINPVAITDTWEEIIASVNDGTYNEKYRIGDTKELDLGTEGIVEMQIAALDTDELADGSGTAAITWISKQVLNTEHCMNSSLITSDSADPLDFSKFVQGTGNVGGWEYSEMRAWLKEEIKPLMPSDVQNAIKPVIKNTFSIDTELKTSTVKSTEDIWIPSVREVIGFPSDFENEGPLYVELFGNDYDRVKKKSGASDASVWWLRSITHAGSIASISFATVNEDGSGKLLTDYPSVETPAGVVLGFCM